MGIGDQQSGQQGLEGDVVTSVLLSLFYMLVALLLVLFFVAFGN